MPSAALTVQHSPAPPALLVPGGWRIEGLPGPVRDAGPSAERRLLEFFTAEIRNPNTRLAYASAAGRFFAWCEHHNLALGEITPFAVAAYVEEMQEGHALPTVKQHLSALRALLDYLVVGQVLPSNPAAPVRGPKHVVKQGKTPVPSAGEARTLLDSIDLGRPAGLRDRALLATMVYSFARVGAMVSRKTGDVVELRELPSGAILKCLGNGRKGSIPVSVTGCAVNQVRSAGLDGASASGFLPAKAQAPEHSYSSKSTTSP